MLLLECLVLLTAALCCSTSPPGHCGIPERSQELELQGEWPDESYPPGKLAVFNCRPGYSRLGAIKKVCSEGKWISTSSGKCRKKPCGHPEDIPFGFFELKEGDEFVFGAVVEYFCDEGYQMVSKQKTRECTANGWSNFPPHCEARKCPPVVPAEGVNVISSSYDEEFSMGQVVRFECKNPRLKLEGPSEVFCTSEGEWNEQPPICKEASCNVPEIPNGSVDNPIPIYKENEKLSYKCDEKYKVYQRSEATCTKNGWSPEPACTEIICYPEYVANGKLEKTKDIYRDGEIIDLKCDYGFQIEHKPDEPRVCTATGWSPPPKCISKKCSKPNIENGRLYNNYGFPKSLGNYIYYTCNSGYSSPSKDYYGRSFCSENGWNPPPRCLQTCSHLEASLENAYLETSEQIYLSGDKVKFTCYKGYSTPNGRENGEKECLPNGRFTPAKCSKTCEMRQLLNGKYSPNKRVFDVGEYIRFECNEGFMIKTRKIIENAQCLNSGWSVIPECIEITCTVQNSQLISEKRQYKYGDVVQFSCPRGYKIIGSDKSQCFHYGWGPSLPTCEEARLKCPPASSPPNAEIVEVKNEYYDGDTIEIRCVHGFTLYGPAVIHCQNGKWNSFAQCIQLHKCEKPPSITDGEIIEETKSRDYFTGHIVKYRCNRGFHIIGSVESQCTEGKWLSPPECIGDSCEKPPPVANGAALSRKVRYEHGDSIEYVCHKGFKKTDNTPSKCLEGKWWNIPTCVSTTCDSPPSIDNGHLKYPVKNEYQSGEKVHYECRSGYAFQNNKDEAICEEREWKSIPVCRRKGERCIKPPTVKFGDYLGERRNYYESGSYVEYKCPDFYKMQGNKFVRCQDGVWGEPPTCLEPCTAKEIEMKQNNIVLRWEAASKLYSEHGDNIEFACIREHEIANKTELRTKCNQGVIPYPKCVKTGSCYLSQSEMKTRNVYLNKTKEILPGETVTFECYEGMVPETSLSATCVDRKLNYPKCVISKKCTSVPEILNGKIRNGLQDSYESGSSVEFECNENYALSGSINVKCENGIWVDLPRCLRPCKILEEDLKEKNIALQSSDDLDKIYKDGEEVNIKCNSGFRNPNPSSSLKGECSDGKMKYQRCFSGSTCRLNQDQFDQFNLELDPVHNNDIYYGEGEDVIFKCKMGFSSTSELTQKCTKTQLTYPRCIPSGSPV
ncbi:coagulation factor XIII B chain-like isoform X3 [Spea bombifrons]|uniref:coagulation factor XIII B chain-like isoform X3 n=1 Tax=Spea bombifrons TaxID=233779 RepID=UPI002349BC8D|nr:coagulation factor XIII B chain-like isoform X3 [Spea bombifrons]